MKWHHYSELQCHQGFHLVVLLFNFTMGTKLFPYHFVLPWRTTKRQPEGRSLSSPCIGCEWSFATEPALRSKLWAEAPLLGNLPDSFNDLEFLHWSDRLPKHDSRAKDDKDSIKAQLKQGEQRFVSVKMENVIVVYFNYTTEAWTFTAKDGCLSGLLATALSVLNKEFIRNKSWKKIDSRKTE